ncbi:MAG: universal stress protein [Thermodesulfovibrionales bacterium]
MKILLSTDGSEYSERAAKFLTRLNWSSDDNITVFHAAYWIPFRYDEEFYLGTLKEIKKEIAPRILDSALDILKPVQAKLSVAIVEGSPEQCIVDVAADSDMDMIVMGSRGIKGIESVFIGSVTRSVAANSVKPVLVVKPPVSQKPGRMKILFATDGSDYSRATMEFLSSIPFPDDTEVRTLNVIWSNIFDIPERFVMEIDERIKNLVAGTRKMEFTESERIIELAREYLNRRFRNIGVLSRVGDPSAEILKTADTMDADIIAVGCRGLRGIKGMMGSVSRNILTHSTSSVLIGKTYK